MRIEWCKSRKMWAVIQTNCNVEIEVFNTFKEAWNYKKKFLRK